MLSSCFEDSESRNEQDQWDQKEPWIKMHEATEMYNQTAFREGLKADAFIHHGGVTHKCMTCLQEASRKVDKKLGIWRLWDQPQPISRASERLQKNLPKVKKELIPGRNLEIEVDESQFERTKRDGDEGQDADREEDQQRIARNYLFRDKIDRELSPPRHGSKGKEKGKGR